MLKQFIQKILPNRMRPLAQRMYWKFINDSSKPDFSKDKYNSLKALKCIVAYNKYGGYCVPESSSHRPAAQKVIQNDIYEPNTLEFILSHCRDGDVVHAGTYFGDFLPALSKGCSPNAKIWAFEPNLENFRCANITLQINDIRNVVLTNAGLGAKKERLLMRISEENGQALGGGSKIIHEDLDCVYGTESVQVVTVDDTVDIDRTISIIQLDVEGHEKEALKGALKSLQRCLPILIIEVLPGSTLLESDWFSENILGLGYRMVSKIHENSIFKCES